MGTDFLEIKLAIDKIFRILYKIIRGIMGVLDNLLGRKIVFSDEMNEFIEMFKKIELFNNCGKSYSKKIFYNYELENEKNVSKKLNYIRNYKEFVTLENLFITVDRRIGNYQKENDERDFQWTWNKFADIVNKRFMNNTNEINFIKIDNNYSVRFNVKNKRNIYKIFRSNLIELFFKNYTPNMPIFYNNILEIYKNGHIIVGWEGKTIENDIWSKEGIKSTEGKLIIY
ncbi:MAG: hypothetical protein LBU76_09350 [Azoarcus sp.]|nr:hypothetical protein [Azoarcus sp.]